MNKKAALETLLFQYGEPVSIGRIADILELDENSARDFLRQLSDEFDSSPERGLMIVGNNDEFQLVTKPEFQSISQKLIREEFKDELSPASLETLSIIAYLGPIPRSTIDYIRGVNSSFTLRNLLIRGLIERNSGQKSHIYHYQASFDFLKHLGLKGVEDLPEYDKYKDILKEFEIQTTV